MYAILAKCDSHNEAEAQAALFGIKWCIQNGVTNFTIELDSLLATNMLKNNHTQHYKSRRTMKEISQYMNPANITPTHCYREANQVADFLAKYATSAMEDNIYLSFNQMPRGAKGPFLFGKISGS